MNKNKELDVIISLLARQVYGNDTIKEIVIHSKKNPDKYIEGYNACDGLTIVKEIAKVIGVKQPTITPILKSWVNEGILYNIGENNKPLYKKILTIK